METKNNLSDVYVRAKVVLYEEYAGAIFYNCQIKCGQDSETSQWTIKKRFSDFVDLHKNLQIKYADLPELPK